MTKARVWQFNAVCSLILLTSAAGIFWSWRDVFGIGHSSRLVDAIPLVKKTDIFVPKQVDIAPSVVTSSPNLVATPSTTLSEAEKKEVAPEPLPKEINLDVPFTSQAPEKNWEQPWQDACEEAAVLMLAAYYKDFGLTPLFAKDEIIKMVTWEETKGWGGSIEIEKIKELVDEFVIKQLKINNYKLKIITDPTVEEIKRYVANGTPVYVVADGKVLPNPHFTNGGPEYHALIIRGYTNDSFITNDPGTQFGKNFSYKYNDLMKSIRDWNGGDVKNGARKILIIE